MHHYRRALLRMRQGESDREVAAAHLIGRRKTALWRELATALGWLDVRQPLSDDEAIAALGEPRRASTTICTLEPLRPPAQCVEYLLCEHDCQRSGTAPVALRTDPWGFSRREWNKWRPVLVH